MGAIGDQKRALDPLELKVQTVTGARNLTWVLCNSSKCSYPLSQLSSPRMETFCCKASSQPLSLPCFSKLVLTAESLCQNTVQEWSHGKGILSAWKKTPGKQDKNLVTSVSSKTWNCSWNVLSCLSACRSQFKKDVELGGNDVHSSFCSANATPEFEGRGGDDLGTEIANTLYRIFNNKSSVDLRSLCISPREHCWVLYVDVLLLECGGNLFDAISIAVKAALFNTRIPRVRVLEDEEGAKDIELSDDPYDCIRLSVENVPCIVTLCKIGCRHVVDATLQEEACSLASLLVSVTSKGVVTCMRKVGKGSLDPESIFEMMESSKRVGKVLHMSLQSLLNKEESLGPKRPKVGFLG
ncbi:exosome complex component RRP42 isoform X2 [Arvicanthis niloticus]|uniref:exosome complex component RRP42 isoform X2 n=1 Tax=Arvicanthis niloticus TaxID=61156 RepID=UPI00402B83F3